MGKRSFWGNKNSKKERIKQNKILAEELKYRNRVLSAARQAMREGEDPEEAADEQVKKLQPKSKTKKKKSKNSKSLAFLAPYKIKGRKLYTEKEKKELKDKTSMKFFIKTNKHGLTKTQQKKIKDKQEEKRPPEIVIESEIKDFQRHILRKRVIKRYKIVKGQKVEEEDEGEGEEENMEEEQETELSENEEEEQEEEEEKHENKKKEAVKKSPEPTKLDDGRYQPLYPDYKENDGVEEIEIENENEKEGENEPGKDKVKENGGDDQGNADNGDGDDNKAGNQDGNNGEIPQNH